MWVAIISAIVGGVVVFFITRLFTPDPIPRIEAIESKVSGLMNHFNGLKRHADEQLAEDYAWAERFERVASIIVKIGPMLSVQNPDPTDHSFSALIAQVFSSPDVRGRIETHLVEVQGAKYVMKKVSNEELRRPAIRQTIEEAEAGLEDFRRTRPALAKHYLPLVP